MVKAQVHYDLNKTLEVNNVGIDDHMPRNNLTIKSYQGIIVIEI